MHEQEIMDQIKGMIQKELEPYFNKPMDQNAVQFARQGIMNVIMKAKDLGWIEATAEPDFDFVRNTENPSVLDIIPLNESAREMLTEIKPEPIKYVTITGKVEI